jgi:hypothetical protein
MIIFIYTLLITALLVDVMSLGLSVRRIIKGSGPSGLPVLSWFAYYFLIEWMDQTFIFGTQLRAILALTVFHISCQYLIPLAFKLRMKSKRN